jgi:Tfp pilus assembly protein PilV
MKNPSLQSGFSLVEMMVYVALLTVIVLALVNMVFSFSSSYAQLGALRAAENTGILSMERMIRDIHSATSLDNAQSSFSTSSGALAVVIGTTTTRFYLQNGVLRVSVGGTDVGPLSAANTTITNLMFKATSTAQSQGVHIDMTINGTAGNATRTKKYQTTVVLKNS